MVVGAQLVPQERAAVVGRALGARGAVADGPRPAEAWPGLQDAVRAHRVALGGTWEEFKRVALSVDARLQTYVAFPMEAGQCIDAVVVPDDDVALLDVEATDGDGRVVARAREGPGVRTSHAVLADRHAGVPRGSPARGAWAGSRGAGRARGEEAGDLSTHAEVAWAAAQQPLEGARHARDTVLAKNGYAEPVARSTGTLTLGRRVTVPLDFKALADACARIDVVAGSPLGLVEARLWDDGGALLAAGEGATSVALFACARGPARLELETRGRPGPYAVAFRPEHWRDPAFAAHPLAASRMLGRAAQGPEMLMVGKAAPARAVALDGGHVLSWTEAIAAGRCVRVTVGVQGEGAGVDLRASDPKDGADVDRSEAAHAASVRACAPADGSRSVRFDLSASAGRVDALVGEQTSGQ